ncbi:hypothetical protein SCATT_33880 [Streptantibioticus cattleyicolor NRRL 8057 = DSM 46488]|uniref:Uncharacterized protein n=1 Tax=Streptantibioticus cattleyicolor (strain ATCC 35852 / DSM 46488 / JCM 4925 / NBRC 14057 / NRRL 8057) TaxID=1003195 RepID=G8WQZ9_STREN|nr:hypothetical protein SCATT_33880 [Streptantibioticus cattleyicolor NRRL 8057 = DSM 46488]
MNCRAVKAPCCHAASGADGRRAAGGVPVRGKDRTLCGGIRHTSLFAVCQVPYAKCLIPYGLFRPFSGALRCVGWRTARAGPPPPTVRKRAVRHEPEP